MSLDDYKNKKSLDEKKGSARGLRIEHDHISVMPSGKKTQAKIPSRYYHLIDKEKVRQLIIDNKNSEQYRL